MLVLAALLMCCGFVLSSEAAVLVVGPGEYESIQAAVDDANPGDIIEVRAGTYVEEGQIVINKDLTIFGEDRDAVTIKPADDTGGSGEDRGWFLVDDYDVEFNLTNVTLDGDGKKIYQAIRSYGTGTIDNNTIKNMEYEDARGYGIAAFGNMTISNNTFSNIARVGIAAFDMSLLLGGPAMADDIVITGNTYYGKGVVVGLDYAIEVGGGARAIIEGNTIKYCRAFDFSRYHGSRLLSSRY